MNQILVFWAQALDNTSPDHIELNGKELLHDDTANRQRAVSLMSSIVKAGSEVFDRDNVRITVDSRRFVVAVPSNERDCAGRIAPIVCCGEYNSPVEDGFIDKVKDGLGGFAKNIGRTVSQKHFDLLIGQMPLALKKKPLFMQLIDVLKNTIKAIIKLILNVMIGRR